MKKFMILAALLSVALILPGCPQKPNTPTVEDNNMAVSNETLPPPNDNIPVYQPPANNAASNIGPVTPPLGNAPGTYTVKQGDTLYKIAREQLGGNSKAKAIKTANPEITDWDHLKVGQVIKLPKK